MFIVPLRFFFPVMTWPGAIVLNTTSLIVRSLIFLTLMLSAIRLFFLLQEDVGKKNAEILPAVTAFLNTILLLMVLLPLRGTLCWNMEVTLTPSIIPLVTFNCSFITKELNLVRAGSRGSLVFTKVFIGTPSIYPVSQSNQLRINKIQQIK